MPPRSLTSSFSAAADANNEVVCPLKNHDGSNCRKRCIGEKRFRSMQEHIRRAHPEHYISKLPATEESFQLMISTPPSEKPVPASAKNHVNVNENSTPRSLKHEVYYDTAKVLPPLAEGQHSPDATAAAALAALHSNQRAEWDSDGATARSPTSVELPPIRNHLSQTSVPPFHSARPRELLPSFLAHSPPGRSTTLPPLQRSNSARTRPRKSSISQNARKPKHERQRSRDQALKHVSLDSFVGPTSRKAYSAEPQTPNPSFLQGKRWEDLIEAATSATEAESDGDPIPISPSPFLDARSRASLPPFFPPSSTPGMRSAYQASPLQKALTPPPREVPDVYSSVKSSGGDSGRNFHMTPTGLTYSDSSPVPASTSNRIDSARKTVEHYCASCQMVVPLRGSYACTECICGVCASCAGRLVNDRRPCPCCGTLAKWKIFRVNLKLT